MKYLAYISYDGSNYYGFQKLNDQKTIQGKLEEILSIYNNEDTKIKGTSRTDRGVHSTSHGVSFFLKRNTNIDKLKDNLNKMLPKDIQINELYHASNDFHPRFHCLSKTYLYVINTGKHDIFKDRYLYNYNKKINIKKLKTAAKYFTGTKSYKCFTSAVKKSYISQISKIAIKKKKDLIYIKVTGSHFYKYMIRNIIGAMINYSEGKLSDNDLTSLLSNTKVHYDTVPANGLYLIKTKHKTKKAN